MVYGGTWLFQLIFLIAAAARQFRRAGNETGHAAALVWLGENCSTSHTLLWLTREFRNCHSLAMVIMTGLRFLVAGRAATRRSHRRNDPGHRLCADRRRDGPVVVALLAKPRDTCGDSAPTTLMSRSPRSWKAVRSAQRVNIGSQFMALPSIGENEADSRTSELPIFRTSPIAQARDNLAVEEREIRDHHGGSKAPAIGIAVRLTTSNGETLPELDATTITAVIGDMALAELAPGCIGNSMTTGATDIWRDSRGQRGEGEERYIA